MARSRKPVAKASQPTDQGKVRLYTLRSVYTIAQVAAVVVNSYPNSSYEVTIFEAIYLCTGVHDEWES